MQSVYEWSFTIDSYMVDENRRLRPSFQLKLQQEVGERHFASTGLGYAALYEQGLVFVLTRLSTRILRAPMMDERVTLQTWHRGAKGAQFFRCYRFVSETGESLIESVSAFSLVDPVEHKLLRPSAFDKFDVPEVGDTLPHCPDPARIRCEGLTEVATHRVRWSQIDVNRHLNNTEYANLLCDYAPGGMTGKRVTGMELCYHHEAKEGDEITLSACDDGHALILEGNLATNPCFTGKLVYDIE